MFPYFYKLCAQCVGKRKEFICTAPCCASGNNSSEKTKKEESEKSTFKEFVSVGVQTDPIASSWEECSNALQKASSLEHDTQLWALNFLQESTLFIANKKKRIKRGLRRRRRRFSGDGTDEDKESLRRWHTESVANQNVKEVCCSRRKRNINIELPKLKKRSQTKKTPQRVPLVV